VIKKIRPIKMADLPALKVVIDSCGLFPSEMLDDMIQSFLNQEPECGYWIAYEEELQAIAVAYFASERLTAGTFNLYLIAVHSAHQGKGIGENLLKYIENFLREIGTRILLVETSGLESFKRTRNFYLKNGYYQEARIREFYSEGEDKIVFWKKLEMENK